MTECLAQSISAGQMFVALNKLWPDIQCFSILFLHILALFQSLLMWAQFSGWDILLQTKEKAVNAGGNHSMFPVASVTPVTTPYLGKITVNNTTNNALIQISTMVIINSFSRRFRE